MSTMNLTAAGDPPTTAHRPLGLPTAIASAALWNFEPDAAAEVSALPDLETTVLGAGLADLAAALVPGHELDIVAIAPIDVEQARAAEALVRLAPPRLAVLTVGRYPQVFTDSIVLEYDVWSEPDPANAAASFGPLVRSVHEREALAAIQAHRAITAALDEVLDIDGDLGSTIAGAMRALAAGLDCRAAAFWRPSASESSLIRVGCTGPDPALDRAALGAEVCLQPGSDRLLELSVADTPAGTVLRSGRPGVSTDDSSSLVLPARANGRVTGVVVLSGARSIARRRTSFELAISAADRVAALVQAHLSARQFSAVTTCSPLAVVLTDSDGRVVSYNAAAQTLLGVPRELALDHHVTELIDSDSRRRHADQLRQLIQSAEDDRPLTTELELRPAGAPQRRLELTMSAWGTGGDRRYALIASDVTARHQAEQRVAELAYTHRVSGLPNEPALLLELTGTGARWGFIAIEVCRFDHIREIVGSLDAVSVVQALAERLVELVGDDGRVHHLSRAEFAVLVRDVDRARLTAIAQRVSEGLARPLEVRGTQLFLKCAVGMSLGDGTASGTAGLDDALRGLRISREADSPHPSFYDADDPPDLGRLQREADLHGAVSRGELRLHYQPIVDLRTGAVRSFEALARWEHPELGLLAPGMFIDIAEESGLILEIGRWVTAEVCRQLAAWQASHGFTGRISFNVAPRQLLSGDFASFVAAEVARHGLDPSRLVAEIVESAALQDLAAVGHTLQELRRVGLWIALDDFGAGESSLGRLAELPVQVLKLDRSLIRGLPGDRTSRAITHSAIHLARELGLSLVSEGIETEAQRDHLRELPGRYAQGYLFGRPQAPDQAIRLV